MYSHPERPKMAIEPKLYLRDAVHMEIHTRHMSIEPRNDRPNGSALRCHYGGWHHQRNIAAADTN
jgi:hypothetical protein